MHPQIPTARFREWLQRKIGDVRVVDRLCDLKVQRDGCAFKLRFEATSLELWALTQLENRFSTILEVERLARERYGEQAEVYVDDAGRIWAFPLISEQKVDDTRLASTEGETLDSWDFRCREGDLQAVKKQ